MLVCQGYYRRVASPVREVAGEAVLDGVWRDRQFTLGKEKGND